MCCNDEQPAASAAPSDNRTSGFFIAISVSRRHFFLASTGVSLPLGGVLPAGVIAPFSWPCDDIPPFAGAGINCGGVVAATGVGLGMGLPCCFMFVWKFFTALSSAAVWSALAFSAAAASFAFFSSAAALAFSSGGGGGGIFAHTPQAASERITAAATPRAPRASYLAP